MDNYDLVPSGLIKLIKQNFNQGVDHAGVDIGQPTSFFVGCALNLNPTDIESEIRNLHRKILAGADFILTQPIYDAAKVENFLKIYRDTHGELQIPMLVGILPLVTARHAAFLHHEVPGIVIPDLIMKKMEDSGDKAASAGIKIAIELIESLKNLTQGTYIMPAFNRFDYAAEIIESVHKKG